MFDQIIYFIGLLDKVVGIWRKRLLLCPEAPRYVFQ